ncbi:hypothetical protein [Oceanobacillus sp. CFH 90083]|uniref:hypothetical protein n=1 Tax=Oceanobacillus sp. CFH 90083 TaxID=2592336 RepID=UPI00128D065B|nr:hypothetical protein [Oceanobacillus sp. CFH 90083]
MKILQSVLYGFCFVLIYILIILSSPLILKLIDILSITQLTNIFGIGLFTTEASQDGLYSQLSLFGGILSFLTGIIFYFIIYPIKENRRKRS